MITLEDFLQEQFKDKKFEEEFYRGFEKVRVAAQITYFREARGLTQAQLAEMLGTSQSTIARLENPFYKNYSLNTLRKIAQVLNLELVVSLREKDTKKKEDSDIEKKNNVIYYKTWMSRSKSKNDYTYEIGELENKQFFTGDTLANQI